MYEKENYIHSSSYKNLKEKDDSAVKILLEYWNSDYEAKTQNR